MANLMDRLASERYVSLTTFRRDGRPVPTPVWLVRDGDRLVVWTGADSGKVKRIRGNPSVTIAPCTVRGQLRGEPVPARARVLPAGEEIRIMALIRKKYRFQGWLVTLRARRRLGSTVGIAIEPAAGDGA